MTSFTRHYEGITYDETNSGDILDFLEPCGANEGVTWTAESEDAGTLVIGCYMNEGTEKQWDLTMTNGVGIVKFTSTDGVRVEGPYSATAFGEAFEPVPTLAQFNALVQRVEQLENP